MRNPEIFPEPSCIENMSNDNEQIKVYTTRKGVRVLDYAGPRAGYYGREEVARYNVVRMYRDAGISRRIIRRGLTLSEAQAHCSDPETSSSTCEKYAGRKRTRRMGAWFDGYDDCR